MKEEKNKNRTVLMLVQTIWSDVRMKQSPEREFMQSRLVQFIKPPAGYVKLNTDGSLRDEDGEVR